MTLHADATQTVVEKQEGLGDWSDLWTDPRGLARCLKTAQRPAGSIGEGVVGLLKLFDEPRDGRRQALPFPVDDSDRADESRKRDGHGGERAHADFLSHGRTRQD